MKQRLQVCIHRSLHSCKYQQYSLLLFSFLATAIWNTALAEKSSMKLLIKGEIQFEESMADTSANFSLDVYLDKGTKLVQVKTYSSRDGLIAEISIAEKYKTIRIVIHKAGFKSKSKNALIRPEGKHFEAKIGTVLLSFFGPRLENIGISKTGNGYHRFSLSLYNPTDKTILFNQIKLEAKTRTGARIRCSRPRGMILTLEDQLYIANQKVEGSILDEEGYFYDIKGTLKDNFCSGIADLDLDLEIPLEFYVTANDYSLLDIFIPVSIQVTNTENLDKSFVSEKVKSLELDQFSFLQLEIIMAKDASKRILAATPL